MINLDLWKKRKKELNLTFQDLAELSKIPKRTFVKEAYYENFREDY